MSCAGAVAGGTSVVDGTTVTGGSVLIPTVDAGRWVVVLVAVGIAIVVAVGTVGVGSAITDSTAALPDERPTTSAATSDPTISTTAAAASQAEGASTAGRHDRFEDGCSGACGAGIASSRGPGTGWRIRVDNAQSDAPNMTRSLRNARLGARSAERASLSA